MDLITLPEQELPVDLAREVQRLHDAAWPPAETEGDDEPAGLVAHDPRLRPLVLILVDGLTAVVSVALLHKRIHHEGVAYRAAGLATVVTDPRRRREGHGLVVVRAARARVERDGTELVLFTCQPALVAFYEAAGFELLPGTQLIGGTADDPFPSSAIGAATLGAFFGDAAKANRDGFVGADVELFPGAIDRLW